MRVKTAISIEKDLFRQAEQMATERGLSRSGLFSAALEELIQRDRNQKLLKEVNKTMDSIYPNAEEEEHIRRIKTYHRKRMAKD